MWQQLKFWYEKKRLSRNVRYFESLAKVEAEHLSNAINEHTNRRIAALNLATQFRMQLNAVVSEYESAQRRAS
jgi:hypothetical protein